MFDIGWSELLAIGLVALIVIGPKELPTVLRTAGQWMGKIKRMASEFQGQFQEALREAEVADLKEQADDLTGSLKKLTEYDPLADVDKDKANEQAKEDDSSEWDEPPYETPEHIEPAAESASETKSEPAAETDRLPATPVAAVEAAPAPEPAQPAETEDLTPAERPPPKQAGGTA